MAKRKIAISLRQATVRKTSTFNPDKHGDELSPARDIGLVILLEKQETAQFFGMAKTKLDAVLWDSEGEPLLPVVKELSCGNRLKLDGKAQIGIMGNKKLHEIDNCMMGKIQVCPQSGFRATIRCNLHVDPTGIAEDCDRIALEERCRFSFGGSIRKGDDDADPEDKSQGKLPV